MVKNLKINILLTLKSNSRFNEIGLMSSGKYDNNIWSPLNSCKI